MNSYFPLVGILVSKGSKENIFRGDKLFLRGIQQEVQKIGGLSFVFTPDGFSSTQVTGYFYVDKTKKWAKAVFPLPNVVYNRISSRKAETKNPFIQVVNQCYQKNIPFFNDSFFNKWTIHQILQQNKQLLPHLPKTIIYSDLNSVFSMLYRFKSIYLKPVQGYKGKGIFKVSFHKGLYELYEQEEKTTFTKEELSEEIKKRIEEKQYIIQKEIKTDQFEQCKYDLRAICIYDEKRYNIINIGVRKANKGNILTHVPNGGEIIHLDKIKNRYDKNEIFWLADEVGKSISAAYHFVGEFSLDIGLSRNGHPYIFDINSKPMIFDEEYIQNKRNKELAKLFHTLAVKRKEIEPPFHR
ncbi:YheC/YheD family protein [Metabacillus fastidiosus]|uniref:YheC/YheD family protein n=1 Tax=Metabacillus fastidiosus TaxID=1458 RepID=A0ABU6NTF2_9BACI|nr:YheC/YheD family protein [Metabacillus fastidiosus]